MVENLAAPGIAGTKLYTYLRDELGTVIGVVGEEEDNDPNSPNIPARYLYSPYGEAHIEKALEVREVRFEEADNELNEQVKEIEDPELQSEGSLTVTFSAALDVTSLWSGVAVERYDGEAWVAVPQQDLLLGYEDALELKVLIGAGWLRGWSYHVRVAGVMSGRFPGGQNHLFQGQWTDPVTGIAYARARWYDGRNAGWLSEDPLLDVDSPNLYAFVGWGPQSSVDPLGLEGASVRFPKPEEQIARKKRQDEEDRRKHAELLAAVLVAYSEAYSRGGSRDSAVLAGVAYLSQQEGFSQLQALDWLSKYVGQALCREDDFGCRVMERVGLDRPLAMALEYASGFMVPGPVDEFMMGSSVIADDALRCSTELMEMARYKAQIIKAQARISKKRHPTKLTVIRDRVTGEVELAASGPKNTAIEDAHSIFQRQAPPKSLEAWVIPNCSEFKAADMMLKRREGAVMEEFEFFTIDIHKNIPWERCLNCEQTIRGGIVYLDPVLP